MVCFKILDSVQGFWHLVRLRCSEPSRDQCQSKIFLSHVEQATHVLYETFVFHYRIGYSQLDRSVFSERINVIELLESFAVVVWQEIDPDMVVRGDTTTGMLHTYVSTFL